MTWAASTRACQLGAERSILISSGEAPATSRMKVMRKGSSSPLSRSLFSSASTSEEAGDFLGDRLRGDHRGEVTQICELVHGGLRDMFGDVPQATVEPGAEK